MYLKPTTKKKQNCLFTGCSKLMHHTSIALVKRKFHTIIGLNLDDPGTALQPYY